MSDTTGSPRTPAATVSTFFGSPDSAPDLNFDEASGANHPVTAQRSLSTTVAVRRRQYIKRDEDAKHARQSVHRLQAEGQNMMKRARSVSLAVLHERHTPYEHQRSPRER